MPDYTAGGVDAGTLEDSYIELFKTRDARVARLWEHAEILYSAGKLTVDDVIGYINDVLTSVDQIAYSFDRLFSADFIAKILDNLDNTNFIAKILDNTNLSIQKGQEIVDAMSNPSKIGIGGRRGYLGDDWEDNKLTSRDKAAVVATTLDKIFQKFRPEWEVCYGTWGVDAGVLYENSGSKGWIRTPSSKAYGTWKYKGRLSSTASDCEPNCFFIHDDVGTNDPETNGNGYEIALADEGNFVLRKISGGTASNLSSVTWSPDTEWHEIKVTRADDDTFECFLDGVSKITTTDSEITTSEYIYLWTQSVAGRAEFDDLEVY